jgi:hypothetical protein
VLDADLPVITGTVLLAATFVIWRTSSSTSCTPSSTPA